MSLLKSKREMEELSSLDLILDSLDELTPKEIQKLIIECKSRLDDFDKEEADYS